MGNILVQEEKAKVKMAAKSLYTALTVYRLLLQGQPESCHQASSVLCVYLPCCLILRLAGGIDSHSWVMKEKKSTGCFLKYFVVQNDFYYLVIYQDHIHQIL